MNGGSWLVPEAATAAPGVYLAVAAVAVLLTGFSKGGFGGGLGVLATPLLMQVLPANVALAMMLPVLIVCDLFTLRHFPREWDPPAFWRIAGGSAAGILLGTALLVWFGRPDVNGERCLKLVVGGVSVLFCLLKAWSAWRAYRRGPSTAATASRPGWVAGSLTGVACGVSTMLAHAAGQIVSMYFLSHRLDRRVFVGTTARYYLTFNALKIPFFFLAGALSERSYITFETLRWNVWMIPLCAAGVGAGAWLNRRMSGAVFTMAVYVLLFLTGVRMLATAW
ncbi:MAG: Sulfite exporter TauE/SafE [Lentisphaerae bacterium ADurb.BinA184]|nr:MAG: Sulfite exporter TauE/SafE [Lentisphaerae bacterium ADurb.BinA184]